MGQSRAEKPILIDQNLKFQISRLGGAMLAVVRRWTARRHHLCGAANVNTTNQPGDRRCRRPGEKARVSALVMDIVVLKHILWNIKCYNSVEA